MAFWALARWLLHGNACVLLAVCSASALLCSRLEVKYNAIFFFLILLVMLQVSPWSLLCILKSRKVSSRDKSLLPRHPSSSPAPPLHFKISSSV